MKNSERIIQRPRICMVLPNMKYETVIVLYWFEMSCIQSIIIIIIIIIDADSDSDVLVLCL